MEPMEVAMTSVRPMAPISRNRPTAIWCTRNMMHQKVKNLHAQSHVGRVVAGIIQFSSIQNACLSSVTDHCSRDINVF